METTSVNKLRQTELFPKLFRYSRDLELEKKMIYPVFAILYISGLLIPGMVGQPLDCDGFGGCFCSTDVNSDLYLSWIAPDVGDYLYSTTFYCFI
jgi:hypothetical protein